MYGWLLQYFREAEIAGVSGGDMPMWKHAMSDHADSMPCHAMLWGNYFKRNPGTTVRENYDSIPCCEENTWYTCRSGNNWKKVDLCFRNQKGNFCKSNAHLFAWQWKIWPNIELIFCILCSHKCVLGLFWLWPTLAGRHLKTNGLIWQWASQPERISHLFYSSHLDVFPAKYINCMIYLDFS